MARPVLQYVYHWRGIGAPEPEGRANSMGGKLIYVREGGKPDLSRWLRVSSRGQDECILHLSDLCHPGLISALTSVVVPLSAFRKAVAGGALQATQPNGYVTIARRDDLVHLEFGSEGERPTKVSVSASELQERLEAIGEPREASRGA
jgi:hypothetical protein